MEASDLIHVADRIIAGEMVKIELSGEMICTAFHDIQARLASRPLLRALGDGT